MATKRKYAYYIKGNQIGIIQREDALAGSSNNEYGMYKSPTETISAGLEIQYAYSPTFKLQSTGTEGTDFHRFLGWGSDGTNLLLFTFSGASSVVNLSSLFSANDWIYI